MKDLRVLELTSSLGVTITTALPPGLAGAMSAQIIADLGVSHTAFGFGIGAFFLSTALLSPLAGRLVDRLGDRNSVRLIAALSSLSMLGIAAVGANYPAFVGSLLLGGVGAALGGPTGSLLLAGAAAPARQPFLFGIRQAFVPAGSLVGGLAVPVFAVAVLDWRWAFLAAGLLVLGVTFPARYAGSSRLALRSSTAGRPYHVREVWLLGVVFALAGFAATSFTSFVVDYAVTRGLSVGTGGTALALGSGSAILSRVVVGYSVGRLRLDSLEATALLLLVGAGGFLWILLGQGTSLLPGSVLALAGAWGWTGLVIYAVTFGFGESPGRANGVVQAGGAAGGIMGPTLTGWAVEHFSYDLAWGVSALFVFVSASAVITMCIRRRQRP